jgi:hypothetical protein
MHVNQNIGSTDDSIISQFSGGEGNEYAILKTSDEEKMVRSMAEPKSELVVIQLYSNENRKRSSKFMLFRSFAK